MKSYVNSRRFFRTAIIAIFAVVAFSLGDSSLFAKSSNKVTFSIKKGSGGCSLCGKEVSAMLKDKEMLAKLKTLFPDKTKVYFYVRKPKSKKVSKGVNIAVGSCASSLKSDVDLYIPGCRKNISKNSIFKAIVEKFKKPTKE